MTARSLLGIAALLAATSLAPVARPAAGPALEDPPPLAPGEVARLGDVPLTEAEFHRYLGAAYARLPAGDLALQQLLVEGILRSAAESRGVTVSPVEVDGLLNELERRARDATDGARGLLDSLDADPEQARRSATWLALQRAIVRDELGLPDDAPVEDAATQAWLESAVDAAALEVRSLEDPVAATWSGGEIARRELGARVATLLPSDERSGALTELLGILLIHRKAAELGVAFQPEDAARELVERDRIVAQRAEGLTYADVLEHTTGRTQEELVASPRFAAEVLLAVMVERNWSDERLSDFFERERPLFAARYGEDARFEDCRAGVLREVRQRTYQQLFRESTIARRF